MITRTVKVGDKLLYRGGSFHTKIERIVTVTKVTPTGRIKIDYCESQFDSSGKEMGKRGVWDFPAFLSIPSNEDFERIKAKNTKEKALSLMSRCSKDNLSYKQAIKIIEILDSKKTDEREGENDKL